MLEFLYSIIFNYLGRDQVGNLATYIVFLDIEYFEILIKTNASIFDEIQF